MPRSALALAALVLSVVAMGGRRAANAELPPNDYHATARDYARSKLSTLLARWRDPRIAVPLQRLGPLMLPGIPLEALLAFGVSSTGPREDLGTAVGLWGVERSLLNTWATDGDTRRELGRSYDPTRYADDIEAQVYTGLRRYRQAIDNARRTLGGDYNAPGLGPWEYQTAVASYSSGGGTLGRLAARYTSQLRAVPRSRRFSQFAELVSADGAASSGAIDGIPLRGLVGAAWTATRPRERYESARALAAALGRPQGWYTDPGVSEAVDRQLGAWTHVA